MIVVDVLKCHILGEVEYAQHNFARLKPLLYSLNGRCWTGVVDKAWFPSTGLVFSLATDLRFAPAGSLWTFQVRPNERQSGAEESKDAFMTIQVKPATRFLTELEPLPSEALRILATIDGFEPKSSTGGVLFPEADDRWILATEFERGADERARLTNARALGHMRVLEGTLNQLAGCATPDGRWALPVLHSGHGSDIRNWRPPAALADQIAGDLRKWLPHAPNKARAVTAATALRELAPALEPLSALRSVEARAAFDRVTALTENAADLMTAVDELVEALLASPAIASAMESEKAAMRRDLETQALESAERFEATARQRLAAEQAQMRDDLSRDQTTLDAMRSEIAAGEAVIEDVRRRQRTETAAFTRSLESLITRAKKEPAAYAAEWLARLGLDETGAATSGTPAAFEVPPADAFEPIDEATFGRALMKASPIRNDGVPRFLLMDAALRARELVVGLGGGAREAIESWLADFAPLTFVARVSDPTLLGFDDLLPTGPRGPAAPLASAIACATAAADRVVVVLLDDVDVAAGGYWLPQAARATRRPADHGLPSNLFLIALVEGEPSSLGLSLVRAGELFPISFQDTVVSERERPQGLAQELPLRLFAQPLRMNGIANREAALAAAAAQTFNADDVDRIRAEFRAYLGWAKSGAAKPDETMMIARVISAAAEKMLTRSD